MRNAAKLREDVRMEILQILLEHTTAPFGGLASEKMINVLEVDLELRKHCLSLRMQENPACHFHTSPTWQRGAASPLARVLRVGLTLARPSLP